MEIFKGSDQKCVSAKENVKEKSEEKHVARNVTCGISGGSRSVWTFFSFTYAQLTNCVVIHLLLSYKIKFIVHCEKKITASFYF